MTVLEMLKFLGRHETMHEAYKAKARGDMKKFEQLVGNVSKGVELDRIMSFLKQDAEAMIGRNESEDTKKVVIEISVKEVEDVI